MVKTFLERLVLIHDRDVADLVELMQTLDAMLDQFGKLDGAFDRVGHAFDHDVVRGSGGCSCGAWGGGEQLVGPLEIPADSDASLDADLVGRKRLLRLLDSIVLFCHGCR